MIELIIGLLAAGVGVALLHPVVNQWYRDKFVTANYRLRPVDWFYPERAYKINLWLGRYVVPPFFVIVGVMMIIGGIATL